MDSGKSNKISDIVKLKRMLKKWRKKANSSGSGITKNTTSNDRNTKTSNRLSRSTSSNSIINITNTKTTTLLPPASSSSSNKKRIAFLKRTLSFPDNPSSSTAANGSSSTTSKGYLAVDVGTSEEILKRFTIPTGYLSHQAFAVLLKDAEEEFGFQQEGVLRIPCNVADFERILRGLQQAKNNNKQISLPLAKLIKRPKETGGVIACGSEEITQSRCQRPPDSPYVCR